MLQQFTQISKSKTKPTPFNTIVQCTAVAIQYHR